MKPLDTTVEQVLREAIESEISSRVYYRLLATRAADEPARAKLIELSERQILHRVHLERRYRQLVGKEPPELPEPHVEIPADLTNIDIALALRIALEHERESESNFRFLFERSTDPALTNLFSELAEMEWKHKAEAQAEYDAVARDPEDLFF